MSDGKGRRRRRVFDRDPREAVEDEISFHMEMRVRDYELRGLDRDSARHAAQARFGDSDAVRRQCERMGEGERRAMRRRLWLSELRQDLRFGARMMARTPFVFAVVVCMLALSIGASTAMFSVVNRVLLSPLPYATPERLVRLWEISPQGDDHNAVSAGNYWDWRARASSFAELGAHRWPFGMAMTGDGDPMNVTSADVTPSVMSVLGVSPLLGRGLSAEDAIAGGVVVLSHGFWSRRFGADPEVLGRGIVLDDAPYTVVGVMPPSFDFPTSEPDFWRPMVDAEVNENERRSHSFGVVGRLKDGVSLERAQSEMRAITHTLAQEHPQFMKDWSANVVPLHADLVAGVKPLLVVLLAGVIVVLLVACANVANLLLARAIVREREMSLRGALGAGRARLVRQVLSESLLLALLGGVLGVAVAGVALNGLLALAPPDIPLIDEVRIDPRVLGFAGAVTLLSTVAFGVLPALRLARADLHTTLRGSDARWTGAGHAPLRAALLVAEIALSLVLLAGAGLLVRSSAQLGRVDYGYQPEGLVAAMVDLPRARYDTPTAQREFYARLLERVRQIPGVASATATSQSPGSSNPITVSFAIEGRPSTNPSGREEPQPLHVVSTDYFRALDIPMLRGRAFEDRDRAAAPEVVIINQSLARLHWPDEDPVGRRMSPAGPDGPWKEIIGVAGDTRMRGPDERPAPAFYMPFEQKPWNWLSWQTVIARPTAGARLDAIVPALRTAVWELDPELPIERIATVDELYAETLARRRFAMVLLIGFAGTALLLGVIGMYGVLAYSVAQRRREIGIQMALGATRGRVVGVVLKQALRLAALGIALGAVTSLAFTRLLRSLLYEVSPWDPVTLLGVALVVLTVALLAAWLPAARATRVDPLVVMKSCNG
jgi:putative ABC transport system permease protein